MVLGILIKKMNYGAKIGGVFTEINKKRMNMGLNNGG